MLINSNFLFITVIPLWLIWKIINLGSKLYKRLEIRIGFEILKALFFFYILLLISITLFPIRVNMPDNNYISYNFIPFKSIIHMQRHGFYMFTRNVLGNIIIFAPFGFLTPMICKNFSKLAKVILYSFLLSLIIEALQSIGFIERRSFDVDDLLLNTIGAIAGFILYKAFIALMPLLRKLIGLPYILRKS
ncbi:VanZ family protein [Thermotalea metallivorans]|uniref:VanZ-like domain-containing protein n=1 Tax=Thermotalea metallivorans TaxID=520762 RepID=A0A140L5W6_9FIRM|nr:VanZ family protein [Thermotalea metallivorans]KXG75941.1 hypothetical protein AN619_14040 [Thermotalea metallivorans]